MKETVAIEETSFIQRWGALIIVGVLLFLFTLYLARFASFYALDQSSWGQLGDFIGGIANPIVGLFTIILLSVSLRQSRMALVQANNALVQSQQELSMTREAIVDARELQAKTERALKKQIKIAKHARDMANTSAMLTFVHSNIRNHEQEQDRLKALVKADKTINKDAEIQNIELGLQHMYQTTRILGPISDRELHRLNEKYNKKRAQ
ncbi:MAG TPA: hypothetical protein VL995_11495 [Cellvibrio sp.]|nr:hypothetical protein [Cellvibrio sp.]